MSYLTHVPMRPDDLAIVLCCMEEVNITDQPELQREVQRRLCRLLRKMAPDHFAELVELGKFTDHSDEPKLRQNNADRIADRIDGYDRDDLGLSPDY